MVEISSQVRTLLFDVDFLTRVLDGGEIDTSNEDMCAAKYILLHLDELETSFSDEDVLQIRNRLKLLVK